MRGLHKQESVTHNTGGCAAHMTTRASGVMRTSSSPDEKMTCTTLHHGTAVESSSVRQ